MDFKEYVALNKDKVYAKICDYVPIKEPKGHHSIMRDYIDRQGNYRRPGLLLLSGQMFGAPIEKLILPAAAQQLSEDWILMQDDTYDDSELRRGKPAAHRIYGAVHTINSSNIGHMAMWRMLKDYMLKEGLENGNRLFEKFYDMIEYTAEGQYIENYFIHNTKDMKKATEAIYYRIVDSKTCYYSVYGPLQLGAIAAGANDSSLKILKEIGTAAGVAFQITDDILDMTANEKIFGKKNFGDLYEGKLTLMMLHACKSATKAEKISIDAIYSKKRAEKTPEEIDFLRQIIDKYDGIGYATDVREKYGENATKLLEKYSDRLPDNEYKEIMFSAIKDMYKRDK